MIFSHKFIFTLFLFVLPIFATVYEVGDGMPYTSIGAVPLTGLVAGDEIHVHWRATPYYEKFLLVGHGTEAQPIILKGIPNPTTGDKPIIDGNNAVTSTDLNYWGENRGLIKIGGGSVPSMDIPTWIVVEGFELRNAYKDYTFTDDNGNANQVYAGNAACVYIEVGQDILIKNNEIHGCGNGIFSGIRGGDTQRLIVEGNYIHGNGLDGSIYEHNTYMASYGITYRYNHYGPLCSTCPGNNLKDRSAGVVVHNNWIEDGNRQLDLVDDEDAGGLQFASEYRTTLVYGNILVEGTSGNRQIIHYGGDSGTLTQYRKGTLYLHYNTIISTRTDKFTLVRLSSEDESADIRNNIIHAPSVGEVEIFSESVGTVQMHDNWLNTGWKNSIGSSGSGSLTSSNIITGTNPGFVDFNGQNFLLQSTSPCRNVAAVSSPIQLEYHPHLTIKARCDSNDFGAFAFEQTCSVTTSATTSATSATTSSTTSATTSSTSATSSTTSATSSDAATSSTTSATLTDSNTSSDAASSTSATVTSTTTSDVASTTSATSGTVDTETEAVESSSTSLFVSFFVFVLYLAL